MWSSLGVNAGDIEQTLPASTDAFTVKQAGTELIRVHGNGNVGIGTNEPKVKLHILSTDAMIVPVGTTAQRPTVPVAGMIRFNNDTNLMEGYTGVTWVSFDQ